MKVEFINPFLEATINVLHTMANIKPTPGKPYIKTNHISKGDVTGIIGVAGDIKGSIAVSFMQDCVLNIISSMLGEKLEKVNDETKDAVGELTNMISGQARQEIAKLGYTLHAGIPTVVVGKDHSIEHKSKNPILVIPFTTESGVFEVEVCFEDK